MTGAVYKLLYCSRNAIEGSTDRHAVEIRQILASARKNNAALGITGALFFNGACFAQVLEGPLDAVEALFEKIQQDPRHGDVTLLESGYVDHRDFPEWSMAFAGSGAEEATAFAEFNFDRAVARPSTSAAEVQGLLRSLVVQEDDWAAA